MNTMVVDVDTTKPQPIAVFIRPKGSSSSISSSPTTAPSSEIHLPTQPSISRSSSVSFAPLPAVENRERKYRLGVSHRANTIHNQRTRKLGGKPGSLEIGPQSSTWNDGPHRRWRARQSNPTAEDDDEQLSLAALRQRMHNVSRSFLKHIQLRGSDAEDFVGSLGQRGKTVSVFTEGPQDMEEPEGEGGVWEEELDIEFQSRLQILRSQSDLNLASHPKRRSSWLPIPGALSTPSSPVDKA